jgi:hypothetical protein
MQIATVREFFSTAAEAAQTETGLLLIVGAFVALTMLTMFYRLCRNGFEFRASFRREPRRRTRGRKRK